MPKSRRHRLVRLQTALLAVWLTACAPPSIDPPPSPEQQALKGPRIEVGASQAEVFLRDRQGEVILKVGGEVRTDVGGGEAVGLLLDATATSLVPDYEATLRAGRLAYRLGSEKVTLDRRLYVGAPARQASLETEAAVCDLTARTFVVDQPLEARYGEIVLRAERATAELDLRYLRGERVTALGAAGSRTWRLTAAAVEVTETRLISLTQVTGELRDGDTTTGLTAPRVVWKPAEQWLNCNEGAQLTQTGLSLTADRVTWRQADGLVTTGGATRFTRDRLTVSGTDGTVDLVARTATLRNVKVSGERFHLTATRGQVDATETIRLTGLQGDLEGTRVTADEALWRAAARRLELPRGGRAARGATRVAAGHLVWTGEDGRFAAGGGVQLSEPGITVTGDRLTGPGDLSLATLTPVTARGQADGGRWTLQASRGVWRTGGTVTLQAATGTFTAATRQATATAREVIWQPARRLVLFRGGFHAESPADRVLIEAEQADYDVDAGRFQATGNVRATAGGVAVRNREWTYHFGRAAGARLTGGAAQPSGRADVRSEKEATPPSAKPPGETAEGASAGATGASDRAGQGDHP